MANPYESRRALAEYLLFHYGAPHQVFPYNFGPRDALNFPVRCVSGWVEGSHDRGLDLGCAVGRASFEMSRHCREVVGIDFSTTFIEAAERLRVERELTFEFPVEGALTDTTRYRLPPDLRPEKIRFEVGDATALREDLGSFDVVLAANLLCRLSDPARLLVRFADLVRPGGVLLVTTPCSWMEEFTPREHWLGGFERDGLPVHTLDGLKAALSRDFELGPVREMPFLIREHARKFQYCVAQASRWQRR